MYGCAATPRIAMYQLAVAHRGDGSLPLFVLLFISKHPLIHTFLNNLNPIVAITLSYIVVMHEGSCCHRLIIIPIDFVLF